MTPFCELSVLCRSWYAFWALLICCTNMTGFVLCITVKRYQQCILFLLTFVLPFCLWQVSFNLYRFGTGAQAAAVSIRLGRLSWLSWFSLLLLFTLTAVLSLLSSVRYAGTNITPFAIKCCADSMPCGICYWQDNGHVIFSNHCMNTLCCQLTGYPLCNGKLFRDVISDNLIMIGERVWIFTFRDLVSGGEPIHEMIANDVTRIHAKAETLRKENEKLSHLKEDLRKYSLSIDDIVRKQEILQAKINIHDEMNHLLLSTTAALGKDAETVSGILTLWNRNALLLQMEAEEGMNDMDVKELEQLSSALDIHLEWNKEVPGSLTEGQRKLFFLAAKEAVSNAVKHTNAEKMTITVKETETAVCCRFENSTNLLSCGKVYFTGGLANLALLASDQNAHLSAEKGTVFLLSLEFEKSQDQRIRHPADAH